MSVRVRRGYTLIELIITVLIVVVLAALIIPAMQNTRTPARRSQCKNNLKRIILAMHEYHDAWQCFPPGWVYEPKTSPEPGGSAYSWGTSILPHLDQEPLFQSINFDTTARSSFQSGGNTTPHFGTTVFPMYRCDSDRGPQTIKVQRLPDLATSNYVANFGVGEPTEFHDSTLVEGVFGCNTSFRLIDIRDGTSNTVMVGERRLPRVAVKWPVGKQVGPYASVWAGIPNMKTVSPLSVVASTTDGGIRQSDGSAVDWTARLAGKENSPLTVYLPNVNRTGTPLKPSVVAPGFSAYHTGGLHVGLADGTVRYISNGINRDTYVNLMRRSDGASLGPF